LVGRGGVGGGDVGTIRVGHDATTTERGDERAGLKAQIAPPRSTRGGQVRGGAGRKAEVRTGTKKSRHSSEFSWPRIGSTTKKRGQATRKNT